jgi:hypothetical protein
VRGSAFWFVVGGAVVCALAAGCVHTVEVRSGAPTGEPGETTYTDVTVPPVPTETPIDPAGARGAADAFGDPATADLCGFTDLAPLKEFGKPYYSDSTLLDQCWVKIDTSNPTGAVSLFVGPLRAATPVTAEQRVFGRLADDVQIVGLPTTDAVACDRWLLFGDGVELPISVQIHSGSTPDPCTIPLTAATTIADHYEAGDVAPRDLPADSLGRLDPCAALPAAALAAVPGLTGAAPEPTISGHQCSWQAGPATSLRWYFRIGAAPVASGAGEQATVVAGRPTVLGPQEDTGDYASCGVHTGVRGQIATLFVHLPPEQSEQACPVARAVAEAVWPTMP